MNPSAIPRPSVFDFTLLSALMQKRHRLAFECYAEISEKVFAAVPAFHRDAFDASFFHNLSSCAVEEAYNRSRRFLTERPEKPLRISLGAEAAVDIVRYVQGKGEPPLPSLDSVSARWFNLPSSAFDDQKIYEVYSRYLINLVREIPPDTSNDGPWQPWQLGSMIFWYTKINILHERDILPHEFLLKIS